MNDSNTPKKPHIVRRLLFVFAGILFAVCLIALPLVLMSVLRDLSHPPSDRIYDVTPTEIKPKTDYTRLHLHVVQLDAAKQLAKIRVHGFHSCTNECDSYEERILFFEANKKSSALEESIPLHESVIMPPDSHETSAEITLPIRGNLFSYPFDVYKLGIGVVIERKYADGTVKKLTPQEAEGRLFMTIEEEVPGVNLVKFQELDRERVKSKKADYEYAYATQLNFERPTYLILVVMLVLILSIAVTIFTMTTRPFNQLLINTSALIFGVWSIRSLLLNGYPVDVTLLDTILQALVVFILLSLALRGMNHFHRVSHLRLLPWARIPTHRECPECLTDISPEAKRCPACTSALTPIVK